MNHAAPPPVPLHGFRVVPRRKLETQFSPAQSAYYVLLGRRGDPRRPRERVVLVQCLDRFLERCLRQIDHLWRKHGVHISHVAVKVGRPLPPATQGLAAAYRRAVAVQHLREQLRPRFRRL